MKPGDPLPPSKCRLEETLLAVDGVARASVEAFCCEAGKAILYVGIEERGAPAFPLRDWPQGDLQLPPEITEVYHDYTIALAQAMREGDVVEDISRGHSLMTNIACRVLQERFVGLAEVHLEALRGVLRESDDEEQRAVAAYVLGYAPKKSDVTADLQLALRDPDADVRANALRALRPIAALAQKDPALGIKVETTWFVEMLNSTVLKDRLEAVRTLLMLTDQGMSASTASASSRARSARHWKKWRTGATSNTLCPPICCSGAWPAWTAGNWSRPGPAAKARKNCRKSSRS